MSDKNALFIADFGEFQIDANGVKVGGTFYPFGVLEHRVTGEITALNGAFMLAWHIATIRAKVAELEARESGPKPITDEAFPKDEQVLLGHYDERENMWLWVSSGHFDPEAEKWFCDWSDDYFPPVGHQGITHWMPLPTPPTEDKPGQVLPEWQGEGEYLEGKGDE